MRFIEYDKVSHAVDSFADTCRCIKDALIYGYTSDNIFVKRCEHCIYHKVCYNILRLK